MKLPLQAACQLLCKRSVLFLSLFHIKHTMKNESYMGQMNILSDWLNIARFFMNIAKSWMLLPSVLLSLFKTIEVKTQCYTCFEVACREAQRNFWCIDKLLVVEDCTEVFVEFVVGI